VSSDAAHFTDRARIVQIPAGMSKSEAIDFARARGAVVLEGRARISKYWAGELEPYEVLNSDPNLVLTAGITLLWQLAAGLGGTAWSSSNARLAVGTGTTAAVAGNTALQTESARQIVDSAPNVSGASISFTATVGTGSANVNWRELGVTNASSGGTFLNRLVQDFGTKSSASSWVATLTLTAAGV
jgi:hypothetical protein